MITECGGNIFSVRTNGERGRAENEGKDSSNEIKAIKAIVNHEKCDGNVTGRKNLSRQRKCIERDIYSTEEYLVEYSVKIPRHVGVGYWLIDKAFCVFEDICLVWECLLSLKISFLKEPQQIEVMSLLSDVSNELEHIERNYLCGIYPRLDNIHDVLYRIRGLLRLLTFDAFVDVLEKLGLYDVYLLIGVRVRKLLAIMRKIRPRKKAASANQAKEKLSEQLSAR